MITVIKTVIAVVGASMLSVVIGTEAENRLSADTNISIGAVLACGSLIVTTAIWIGKFLSKQTQQYKEQKQYQERMDDMHKENLKRFRRLERSMTSLQRALGVTPEDFDGDIDDEPL